MRLVDFLKDFNCGEHNKNAVLSYDDSYEPQFHLKCYNNLIIHYESVSSNYRGKGFIFTNKDIDDNVFNINNISFNEYCSYSFFFNEFNYFISNYYLFISNINNGSIYANRQVPLVSLKLDISNNIVNLKSIAYKINRLMILS